MSKWMTGGRMAVAMAGVLLLVVSVGAQASDAPAVLKTATDKGSGKTPGLVRHADGGQSIELRDAPAHGLVARVGEDGRLRIVCADDAHALLEKHAHQRLHDEQAGMAWE